MRGASVAALAVAACLSAGLARPVAADETVATVGSTKITMTELEDHVRAQLIAVENQRYEALKDGLDNMIGIIKAALPPRLYETLYACAVEVAAADLHVDQEELVFLEMLRDGLEIDPLVSAAVERSARVRYRVG